MLCFMPYYSYTRIIIHQQHSKTSRKNVPEHEASDRSQTNKRTHGEKFVKSGERTDKADGYVQDRPRFLTGSQASPPTHPKTNKFCDPRGAARRAQMLCSLAPLHGTCTITWQRTRVLYSTSTSTVRVIVAHRTSTVVVSYCARGFGQNAGRRRLFLL